MKILYKIQKNYKIIILSVIFLYILINLFGGQRGMFSYFEKKEILKNLQIKQIQMYEKIKDIELKNTLLSDKLDYDYIDILIREKLMLGKKGETTHVISDNES